MPTGESNTISALRQWDQDKIQAMLGAIEFMHNGVMPPFAGTDAERAALAAYLTTVAARLRHDRGCRQRRRDGFRAELLHVPSAQRRNSSLQRPWRKIQKPPLQALKDLTSACLRSCRT